MDLMNMFEQLRTRPTVNEESDDQYKVEKVNDSHFVVTKDDGTKYDLEKKNSNWTCSCPGFKYRHTCRHLGLIKDMLPKRFERSVITEATKEILPSLRKIAKHVDIVGSYRRESPDSKDIDIIMDCSVEQFRKVNDVLKSYKNFEPVMSGDTIIRGKCDGIEMDINRLSEDMNYFLELNYRTGPQKHNIALRALAKKLNGSLSEKELVVEGQNIRVTSERDIYKALGVEYQEPKDRSADLKIIDMYRDWETDRKSTRLNSSHITRPRMPTSA